MTQTTITSAEYRKTKKPKRNKFSARKVKHDGHTFDSSAEYRRYCTLKLMQLGGLISQLKVHPSFTFTYDGRPVTYESGRKVTIELDFSYAKEGAGMIYEDCKGCDTLLSKVKRAFFEARFYPAKVSLVRV